MFLDDISGSNPIDLAFDGNSLFCVKAFAKSILLLENVS